MLFFTDYSITKINCASSLERFTIMPVCLTHSFTFTASALRVVNFRIIGTLIPPPFHQRPLGSSNGGPQTLLKVKIIHYFCFPCFSHGLHDDYLRQMYIYLRYISVASIESHYKCLHLPSNRSIYRPQAGNEFTLKVT